MSAPDRATLRIGLDENNRPTVRLNDLGLAYLLAPDGLKIEYLDEPGITGPRVTMVFAPGALDFDVAIELVAQVLKRTAK